MCIVRLKVATSPCAHRWYQLAQPCCPDADLSNCTRPVKIQGWEERVGDCPFCSDTRAPTVTADLTTFYTNLSTESDGLPIQTAITPDRSGVGALDPSTHRLFGAPNQSPMSSPSIAAALSRGRIDRTSSSSSVSSVASSCRLSRSNSMQRLPNLSSATHTAGTISFIPGDTTTAMLDRSRDRDRDLNRRLQDYLFNAISSRF